MRGYNQAIVLRLVEYTKDILERIEASLHEEGTSIKVEKFNTIDSNNLDINYLTINELTGNFLLKLYFKITRKGEAEQFSGNLEIPKLINNVFIIGGKLRIPTNTLDNDDAITVYDENMRINHLLNIQFEEDPTQPDGYLMTLNHYGDEEPVVIAGTEKNMEKYKDLLRLSQEEVDKIKVKLDTDDVGYYLDYHTAIKLIKLGPDKHLDNMIDKRVYSPESNFMKYMNSRDVRGKILTGMKGKFYQYGKVYLKDIQNAIDRYFLVASEKNIDIPTTVNPLVFDAMKYKVVLPEAAAFNSTMTDILDVASTPINNNVNRINELNVCVEIKDDVIHMKCYEYPSQEPVSIPYTSYCTKRVLLNQCWDYDEKKLLEDTPIRYKLRYKVYEGSPSDKFDLIEPKADDKLSLSSRRVPLGNMSDSIRLSMSTSMSKQAVELHESEPSLVTTGHDDSDFELSTLITNFRGPKAVVDKIKDNKVFVKDVESGSVRFYEVPAPTPGANDSMISFNPAVKEGQVLNEGDVVVLPHMLRRKSFELGLNTRQIYMNYLGYTHEDGMVISQSYADRLVHYSVIDVVKELYPDDIIRFIKKVGSKVTSKEVLVNNQTRLRLSANMKDTYTGKSGLLSGMGIDFNQSNAIVPNNMDEGYILDVRIEIDPKKELTSEYSKKVIENFLREPRDRSNDDIIPDKFKNLKANEVEIRDRVSGYISFKILRVNRAKVGDKVSNRYGSKGMVALVLPDECMPAVELPDKTRIPAELLMNPASVLSRKNISQIYEVSLTKCIKEIYSRVGKFISDGKVTEAKEFTRTFYKSELAKLTDEEFVEKFNSEGILMFRMKVGFFSKVSYSTLQEWMQLLGVSDVDIVFCPDVVITETKDGIKGFPMKTYKKELGHKPTYHELGYTEQPCVTGEGYIMKLYHSGDYDGKATSTLMETMEPVMGRGRYREDGQKIGEMELWILLETGTEKFLEEQAEDLVSSQYVFLNELLLAGYALSDEDNNPLLSSGKTKLDQLRKLGQ